MRLLSELTNIFTAKKPTNYTKIEDAPDKDSAQTKAKNNVYDVTNKDVNKTRKSHEKILAARAAQLQVTDLRSKNQSQTG